MIVNIQKNANIYFVCLGEGDSSRSGHFRLLQIFMIHRFGAAVAEVIMPVHGPQSTSPRWSASTAASALMMQATHSEM
jgi:hypothetical protein